jgi:hypothetical protein
VDVQGLGSQFPQTWTVGQHFPETQIPTNTDQSNHLYICIPRNAPQGIPQGAGLRREPVDGFIDHGEEGHILALCFCHFVTQER